MAPFHHKTKLLLPPASRWRHRPIVSITQPGLRETLLTNKISSLAQWIYYSAGNGPELNRETGANNYWLLCTTFPRRRIIRRRPINYAKNGDRRNYNRYVYRITSSDPLCCLYHSVSVLLLTVIDIDGSVYVPAVTIRHCWQIVEQIEIIPDVRMDVYNAAPIK